MSTDARGLAAATPSFPTVAFRARAAGLGSVFGKTIRDARRATVIVAVFLAFLTLVAGAASASAFATPAGRAEVERLATTLPAIFQVFLGRPIGLGTLGGIIEWRYSSFEFLVVPIWSILALSATLAAEARAGSLDVVATAGLTRRSVAAQKFLAHVAAVAVAMAILALVTWATGIVFSVLPGDAIAPQAAIAYAVLTGLIVLVPGTLAFALAPYLGRGPAAAIAGAVMVAAYFINGFRSSIGVLETLSPLSWYRWTYDHVPLAGLYDWASLAPLAGLIVVFALVGIVSFERRDIGSVVPVRLPGIPRALLGLQEPLGRTFGELLPGALTWGLGLGFYAWAIAASSTSFAETLKNVPVVDQYMRLLFPDIDYTTAAGVLQLVFVEFALPVGGLAAATFVSGWASEESSGRLEMLLSGPLARARWVVRSGLAVLAAVLLMAAVVALGIALATIGLGQDPLGPTVGTFVLALYGAAWAGLGIAVGGVVRPGLGAPVVVALTLGTFLLGIVAPALKLPDWVGDLALNAHYGHPLVGEWDLVGVVASVALAVGGVLAGAYGLARRDLRG